VSNPEDGRATQLDLLQREMVQTVAAGMLFHQAVADRVGLSLSELKCLTLVSTGADVTAGDIAEGTGLTTGAVTRLVDRLVARGWVRREPDPDDRRRVLVRPVPDRAGELAPLYAGMAHAWADALADYDDDQVALLLELFTRMRRVAHDQAARLRSPSGD
jgi:DNA-binding MarR family transcriptional regulator